MVVCETMAVLDNSSRSSTPVFPVATASAMILLRLEVAFATAAILAVKSAGRGDELRALAEEVIIVERVDTSVTFRVPEGPDEFTKLANEAKRALDAALDDEPSAPSKRAAP